MNKNEIKIDQIVLIDHDPATRWIVIELTGGQARICKESDKKSIITAPIANLIFVEE